MTSVSLFVRVAWNFRSSLKAFSMFIYFTHHLFEVFFLSNSALFVHQSHSQKDFMSHSNFDKMLLNSFSFHFHIYFAIEAHNYVERISKLNAKKHSFQFMCHIFIRHQIAGLFMFRHVSLTTHTHNENVQFSCAKSLASFEIFGFGCMPHSKHSVSFIFEMRSHR